MKKLTLNILNLELININDERRGGCCDFCNEELYGGKGVKSPFPFEYKTSYDEKNKTQSKFISVICFSCIKQLAELIDKK